MILLIDAGNSRIKWGWCQDQHLQDTGAASHRGVALEALCNTLWGEHKAPQLILASNVAGKNFGNALSAWLHARWGIGPEWLIPRRKACGVTNAYTHPQHLGADRWAALIGARADYPGALCVVDCGTAVTLDAVNTAGHHLGGLIMPGSTLMERALIAETNSLGSALQRPPSPPTLLAGDTVGAVRGGAAYAQVALIERVCADLHVELQMPVTLIMSGGGAVDLLPLFTVPYRHEPDLVLKGLARLAQESAALRRRRVASKPEIA